MRPVPGQFGVLRLAVLVSPSQSGLTPRDSPVGSLVAGCPSVPCRYHSCMEIIGESAHRVLAYIEAMNRQGCPLAEAQVDAYAEGWAPIRTIFGLSAYRLSLEDLSSMDQDTVTEKMTAYLLR